MDSDEEAFAPSTSAPLRPSLFRPSADPFIGRSTSSSKIFRNLSSISLFKRSYDHWSRKFTFVPSCDDGGSEQPLLILKGLLDILLENDVRGPLLVRLREEINNPLGRGRTFEVFGPSLDFDATIAAQITSLRDKAGAVTNDPLSAARIVDLEFLRGIAVKRAYIYQAGHGNPSDRLSTETSARAFGQQITCAYREIEALCLPAFRGHRNIVQLLGWGLCLDSLEDPSPQDPVIPLLFLERAEFSLSTYLGQNSHDAYIDYEQCSRICLDIGAGIKVIHGSGLIHGDLKLDNILLYPDTSSHPEHRRWTAKLCDFGLAAVENKPGRKTEAYRGTPGWTPCKSSARNDRDTLWQYDIYAYGLIVWCVFTDTRSPPLPLHEAAREEPGSRFSDAQLFFTAAADVQASSRIPREKPRIISVLRGSIHGDQRFWERQPWIYFDETKYCSITHVVVTPTSLMSLVLALKKFSARIRETSRIFDEAKSLCFAFIVVAVFLTHHFMQWLTHASWTFRAVLARLTYYLSSAMGKRRHQQFSRYETLKFETAQLCAMTQRRIDPDAMYTLSHGPTDCYSLEEFHSRLMSALNRSQYSDSGHHALYALARLRSRLPLCCWSRIEPLNILELALWKRFDMNIFAWLCRGPIGEDEVSRLNTSKLWSWIFGDLSNLILRSLRRPLRKMLCLLIQHGLRVDLPAENEYGDQCNSLFGVVLDDWHKFEDEGLLADISRHLVALPQFRRLPQPLMYFLTGTGLPDQIGEAESLVEYTSTILHEAVSASCYPAVKEILLSNFNINAMDCKGRTPARLAYEVLVSRSEGKSAKRTDIVLDYALEAERIFHLLRQNSSVRWDTESVGHGIRRQDAIINLSAVNKNASLGSLPPGWDYLKSGASRMCPAYYSAFISNGFYRERYSGSVTLKKPTFSLFNDQRLALGFRKISSMSGQVYHLDLHRFLETRKNTPHTASKLESPGFKYNDQWYTKDIELVKKEFKETVYTPLLQRSSNRGAVAILGLLGILSNVILRHVVRITRDSYLNFLGICIPLAILSGELKWPPAACIALSLPSLLILSHRMRVAISFQAMVLKYTTTPPYEESWVATTTTFMIAIFSIIQQQYALATHLILGTLCMNTVTVPGLLFCIQGLNSPQGYLQRGRLRGMIIAIFAGLIIPLIPIAKSDRLFLSTGAIHGVAMFAVVLFFICLLRNADRLRFLGPEIPIEVYGLGSYRSDYRTRDIFLELSTGLLSVALTAMCSRSLVSSLSRIESNASASILVAFIIPLMQQLSDNGKALYDSKNGQIDRTVFGKILTALFTLYLCSPVLIILSWILHSSFVLYFNFTELLCVLGSFAMLAFTTWNGGFSYRSGLLLCATSICITTILCIHWAKTS